MKLKSYRLMIRQFIQSIVSLCQAILKLKAFCGCIILQLESSQMQNKIDPSRFYLLLIKDMEKLYKENASDQKIWLFFTSQVNKKLKFEVTFDSEFGEVFKTYFKENTQKFAASQSLLGFVTWAEKLNEIAYRHKFISYRDYSKIHQQIQVIYNSPSNQWLNEISYVRSDDITEFRAEFLYRFCRVEADQAESIAGLSDQAEALQRLKNEYINFFQQFFMPNIDLKVASIVESEWAMHQVKSEMLPQDLIIRLQKLLGSDVGRTKDQVEINKSLVQIAQTNLYQNDLDIQQRLQNQIELIKKALQKFCGLNTIKEKGIVLRLGQFGSLISGFAGLDADLDLTILTNCYVNEPEFLKVLHQFLKKEYQEGDRQSRGRRVQPELILTAKTPLIAIKISETGKSEMKIDIIINNILGIINSKFLNVYAGVRWVKNLGILVKKWGKGVRLIDKNAFSSYAMILMLIHYLIKVKAVKPILDARNRSKDSPHFRFKRLKATDQQQFDVYYAYKNTIQDVCTVERVNYYKILQGFMKYYAYDLWKEEEDLRIITVDQSIDKEIDKEAVITIKDPFDLPHNPGRLKADSKGFMIQKFKEAHEILSQGKLEYINRLFE